jgi:ferredoxin
MLVINPDECIDCGVCIPECPVEAIVSEHDMNKLDDKSWIEINTRMSRVWPNIVDKLDPPIDAENWAKVKEKKHLIEEQ